MKDRKELVDEYAKKIKDWDNKLVEAEKKISLMKEDVKSRAVQEIDKLRGMLKTARKKLNDEPEHPKKAWDEFQEEIEKGWKNIQSSVKKAFAEV